MLINITSVNAYKNFETSRQDASHMTSPEAPLTPAKVRMKNPRLKKKRCNFDTFEF